MKATKGLIQMQLFVPEYQRQDWLGLNNELKGGLVVEAVVVRDAKTGRLATIPLCRL